MKRTDKDMAALKVRLLKAAQSDPDLSPTTLAKRFSCSHVTVRKILREAKIYRVVGQSAEARRAS